MGKLKLSLRNCLALTCKCPFFFFLNLSAEENISVFLRIYSLCVQLVPEWTSKKDNRVLVCSFSRILLVYFTSRIYIWRCVCVLACVDISVYLTMNPFYFLSDLCSTWGSKYLTRNIHKNKHVYIYKYTFWHISHGAYAETLLHPSHSVLHLNSLVSHCHTITYRCFVISADMGVGSSSSLGPPAHADPCPHPLPSLSHPHPRSPAADLLTVLSIIQMDY